MIKVKVNRVSSTSFTSLIKIKSPEEFLLQANKMVEQMPPNSKALSGTGISSLSTGISASGSALNTMATTSDVIAVAHSAKAVGVDSFGIVPSVAAKLTPYATPETMVSSAQHPESIGSMFSGLGAWLHSHFRFIDKRQRKIPS